MSSAAMIAMGRFAIALDYAHRGWRVFPVASGQKTPLTRHGHLDATTDETAIKSWWEKWPDANIGVATGRESGIVVLDVDPRHGGDESLLELQKEYGPLTETPMVSTGGGGFHYFFKYPDDTEVRCSAGVVGTGLDVKADGGYVVAPPSLHPSGHTYKWDDLHHPDTVPLVEIPACLLARMQSEPALVPNGQFAVPKRIIDGQRNDTLYKAARSMKAKGWSPEAIEAAIRAENSAKCSPPLPSDEVERIIANATTQADRPEFARAHVADPIGALRGMSPDEVKATWMNLSDGLDAVAEREVIIEVERLTGIGLRTLNRALSEYKTRVKKEATTCRAGTRVPIDYHPEDVSAMAERVEVETLARANDFELINFAGVLARVVVQKMPMAHQADSDQAPLPTAQIDILNKPKLLPLVERAVVFQKTGENTLVNIAVPEKVLDHLLVNSSQVPKVSALVTHPVVTMSGRIVSAIGIDQETGLLLYGSAVEGLRPYSQSEAIAAIVEIVEKFTDGFEFDTSLDRACAIGMLCTALMRKMLAMSPGVLITAAQQSVGKTTLASRAHLILTGRGMPVMTWPEGNETETNKLVFSALLGSAPLLCFDNVGDGLTFKSPTLAAAMTSPIKEDRILGISRVAQVPTNTLFVLTGNNIELSNDEVHRWIRIRLKSSDISPHKRRFQHPDVVSHGLQIRAEVIRHCIGIIAGYRQGTEKIEPLSRFPQWDALVRQPLMWAGLHDIGKVFDANIDTSPELGAHRALLAGLADLFGDKEFGTRDLIQGSEFEKPPVINEALRALHAKDTGNDRSVGHALSKVCGRAVLVEGPSRERVLSLESRLINGLTRYRVVERRPADDVVG